MRYIAATLIALLSFGAVASAADSGSDSFDWKRFGHLPVQDGGRYKPLDTLAWETLRTLANRASIAEPETGRKLNATAFYLAMLFDWEAAGRLPDPHMAEGLDSPAAYFLRHQPDKWDRAELLRVDYLPLREAVGMDADQKYISPAELAQARIQIPHADKQAPFSQWAASLIARQDEGLTLFEQKALELADKLWSYQQHRMGARLFIVPLPGRDQDNWLSIAQLMRSSYDDTVDPTGNLRKAKEKFARAKAAYHAGDAEAFNLAADDFVAALAEVGPTLGAYPEPSKIDMEVAYNHWAPFRFAWIFTMLACLALLMSMGMRSKAFYAAGLATFTAGIVAMVVGFAMRISISGRAPVTNMYESVVYLGLGTAVIGLVLELIYRRTFILTAAAAVCTVALVLADNCPATLDASLRPLQPVLRNNFWLVTHVMTITLSYAAFALALGVGNITLGYFFARSKDNETISALSKFTYKALQVGVLLLAVGTILGGVWADYSWGRFWGWDPKEVWALIALIGYLAVLHARYAGWVRDFGLAACSVACFSLVVMAWYGVNFVLGAGLHSYGFGGGGQGYVYSAILLQFLYVGAAAARYFGSPSTKAASKARAASDQSNGAPRARAQRPESVAP